MRVTDSGVNLNFLNEIGRQRELQSQLSSELSSGRKLQRPSDDPFGAQQSLQLQSNQSRNTQYLSNTQAAQSHLTSVDSIIDSLQTTLDKALQLTTQGLSGSTTPASRAVIGEQVKAIEQQVISLGNSAVQGQYIFAGSNTSTRPYTQSSTGASYAGNSDAVYTRIDDNSLAQTNVTGSELFSGSKDLFTTFNNIQQALANNDTSGLQQGLDDLKAGIDQTNLVRSQVGATLNHLQQRTSDIQQQNLQFTAQRSQIEDTNIVEASVQSTQVQTGLQVSLNAQARVLSLSLLNFLK